MYLQRKPTKVTTCKYYPSTVTACVLHGGGSAENTSWHQRAIWGGASLQLCLEFSFWLQLYFGFSFAAGAKYSTRAGPAGLRGCRAGAPLPWSLLEEGKNEGIALRNPARTKCIHWHWLWLDATIYLLSKLEEANRMERIIVDLVILKAQAAIPCISLGEFRQRRTMLKTKINSNLLKVNLMGVQLLFA